MLVLLVFELSTARAFTVAHLLVRSAVLLLLAASAADFAFAQEDEALSGKPTLVYDKPCDAQNNRLYIDNTQSFRTYLVTVHWKAAGGKELSAQFYVEPGVVREIGCAVAGAQITEAAPQDF